MSYKGKSGKQYVLEKNPLAEGGEGKVYTVKDNSNVVAKVYKSTLNSDYIDEQERKLIAMVDNPPNKAILNQISWPIDVLYDSKNHFVGVILPKLDIGEELNVAYEYGSTAKYSNMPWTHKIIIARNICIVLDAVHSAGHVVGDFNPRNICVDPNTGRVVFIDTDSYHINDNGTVYRCKFGMPEYLPVEIQRKMKKDGLWAAPFSRESDNFALAIHIFQLLMNGVHPFACRILPNEASRLCPQPVDNILNGIFPFVNPDLGTTIPMYAPPIDVLPQYIQDLFNRAFGDGHVDPQSRPNAEEWYNALTRLEGEVSICKKHKHHEYHNSQSKCPWCEADKRFLEGLSGKKNKSTDEGMLTVEMGSQTDIPSDPYSENDWVYVHPEWITETHKKIKAILEYVFNKSKMRSPFHCDDVIVLSSNPSNRYFLLLDKNGMEVMDIVLNERYSVNDDGWYIIYRDGELFVSDIVWNDSNCECHFNVKYCCDRGSHNVTINYKSLLTRSDYGRRVYTERIEDDNSKKMETLPREIRVVPEDW